MGIQNKYYGWRWGEEDPIFKNLGYIQNVLGYIDPADKSFTSNNFKELFYPGDFDLLQKSWKKYKKGTDHAFEMSYRFKHKDGSWRWIKESGLANVFNTSNNPIGGIGTIQEVTDKKKKYTQLKSILKNVSIIILRLRQDSNNQITVDHISKEALKYWNIPCETLLKDEGYLRNLAHKDDLVGIRSALSNSFAKMEFFECRWRVVSKEGNINWCQGVGTPLKDKDGTCFLDIVITDITKEKLYTEQLKVSEEKYHSLFQHSPQPSWVYDLETLAFLNVNSAAISKYGYSKDEFMGMTLADIRPECELENLEIQVQKTRENYLNFFDGYFKHINKQGEILTVHLYSSPITYNGQKCRQIIAIDISEKMKYLKFIENQNKSLKRIGWMQSHELRAPLVRLMGLINLLTDQDSIGKEERHYINTEIINSANEMDIMTKNIAQIINDAQLKEKMNDVQIIAG
ncbi:PAS domain S-box protein [Arenibacter sp. N53]|uniref:PAS domain-containing protein n=1 Tax=Arenibacter TaxID=178469 RepID=UPI000CD46C91|nr:MULTISPECIES: PAS domain S-box protein [Arenibacter]MCM4151729.1 PAS domain S-box protein [Arenibacter sp. N53]